MTDARRILVAPSILSADPGRLVEAALQAEEAGADLLHIDVMDGQFVAAITFGASLVASLKRASRLPLDVHLMVRDPERHLKPFADAGSDIITLHIEATAHAHRALGQVRDLGVKAGIALNPGTSLSQVRWLLESVDLILVMTVNPGAGGQTFIPAMAEKVKRLKQFIDERGVPCDIEVDGGITPDTAPVVCESGADILVAGSAVYGVADMAGAIRALRCETV